MSTVAPTPELPSDPDELQAEIERRRAHLAQTVSELSARLAPRTLVAQAKAEALGRARAVAVDDNGALRRERLAAVIAGFVALVGLVVGTKVRARRRRAAKRARAAARYAELERHGVPPRRLGRRRW